MTLKHSRLAHALMALRPGAKPLVDFECVDRGQGPELVEGSMISPPTQAEVDGVTLAQLNAAQASKIPGIDARLARIGITFGQLKARLAQPNGS